jgi:hypothetical protein
MHVVSRGSTQESEILGSREARRVHGNSLVESPKCSLTVRVRHHATTRRKERVESPLGFREKLRNPRMGREREIR